MRPALRLLWLAPLALWSAAAKAADDEYLDRIPAPPQTTTDATGRPGAARGHGSLYLQGDAIFNAARAPLATTPPSAAPASWEALAFLDARQEWSLGGDLSFSYSGRLNLRAEDDQPSFGRTSLRHDLREAYGSWRGPNGIFVQVGRINLKSGVALGYNPTDFFKTRAVVEPLSADPSALREDRLGALMASGEVVAKGLSVTFAVAPRVARRSAIYTNADLPRFDPMFDRTNAHDRALVKTSFAVARDFSPEVLLYAEDGEVRAGLNLTRGFGDRIVGYLEWAGGRRANLAEDAYQYGKATGVLPPNAPPVLPTSAARSFDNDIAIGASYSTSANISFNLEYHYHQAGFSGADWRNWFAIGRAVGRTSPALAELWYLRAYAADQQEPLARDSVFARANWQDAFVRHLDLTALVSLNADDGSGFTQANAAYDLGPHWSIGALISAPFGAHGSEFGSNPGAGSFLLRATRYF